MRKINPELWLLLFLVVIAAMLNFVVSSQRMALVFYFLPTLFSACHFGRRHATLTALASIVLVVLLLFTNPVVFNRKVDLPFDPRLFDLALWGGVLMVAGYVTGTLYERNQKTLREMEDGYDGMLTILQNFLANQKYSDAHAYRIAMCAIRVAETLGLDPGSVEDIRTAALLFNLKELGISIEVISKAAQGAHEDLRQAPSGSSKATSKASGMGGSLRRAIPIFLSERQLRLDGDGIGVGDAAFEVQILLLAEEYESLISGNGGTKLAPSQAGKEVVRRFASRSDSLILDAFAKAFSGEATGAGA
ncbi:MAG TPA: hypothetical protein VFE08_16870 [Candidatus Sulfotelmatobacter sp.]|nr:hypothetical protein [Candidatus Sulfotelmatobacter sp.]